MNLESVKRIDLACWFMIATKFFSVPATASTSASVASFAPDITVALIRRSTLILSPEVRNIRIPEVDAAALEISTLSPRSIAPD